MRRRMIFLLKQVVIVIMVLAVTLPMAKSVHAEPSPELGLVNINTADIEQLTTLPGIGNLKAQAIIKYRSEHGPFRTLEGLANVRGIGMKLLDRILPLITITN